ncbi:MAG: hypothetical protein ABSF14_21870 [Terriglobia bacterium]|jgi:hypothetical protein
MPAHEGELTLPSDRFRLEEINLPEELSAKLVGQTVRVEVLPEEPAMTRRFDLDNIPRGMPMLLDRDGVPWNGYWAAQVLYTDAEGRAWRLPRHWLSDGVSPVIEASRYEVTHESSWLESWCPPTWWDLWDINIQDVPSAEGEQGAADILVSVAPGEIARAFWKDAFGKVWRIPHDWRRRRIRLPDCKGLLRNNLPQDIAQEFGGRIVAVNYHPGSLCCLRDGYRVRDGRGGRWPVRAADCVVVGFGDEGERYI